MLEIMGNDKINASNVLNPEVTTKLTKQANAPQVDAVIMNGNKVASRLQYKDVLSTSGIRDITNSTKNGKYNAAKLMGTTECAEKFNKAAEIVSTVLAPFGPVVSVGGGLITAAVTNEVVSEKTKDFIEDVGFEFEYGLNVLGAQVSCFFGSIFGF